MKNNIFNGIGDRMMNNMFRKIDNTVWDMMTGKMGILTSEGIVTLEGDGEDSYVNINMLDDFAMRVPAFAQSTPVESVSLGDLIFVNGSAKGWVIEVLKPKTKRTTKTEGTPVSSILKFKLMTPSGTTTTWTPPKKQMLGFDSGVMVLRSLLNMFGGDHSALTGMQTGMQELMMMTSMMGKDVDFESMMPMLLMSQMGNGANGGSGGMFGGNIMQTMMMMNMLQGKGGNPLASNKDFFNR